MNLVALLICILCILGFIEVSLIILTARSYNELKQKGKKLRVMQTELNRRIAKLSMTEQQCQPLK